MILVTSEHVYTLAKMKMSLIILAVFALLIIILGGITVYLVEHGHHGANITRLSDAIWWAVVTLATVVYGDYYQVTIVGRLTAVFMMLSGIGIFVLLSTLAQRRLQRRVEDKAKD